MTRLPALGGVALLLVVTPALSHDLHYEVSSGEAVVITASYPDDTRFSFESYEIYPAGKGVPVQVGRTDHRGRIVFLPDGVGQWRVKAFSEDGHGFDITLETGASGAVASAEKPLFERYARLFVGLGLIFGLFGLVNLFYRRRRSP